MARADGDPASDVLATQELFLPSDAGASTTEFTQLTALLEHAAAGGYPIRVALIASPADLGSITELWRRPQPYAQFLGEELSLVYRGPVLVAMPNGFGLYRFSRPAPGERSELAGLAGPHGGAGLVTRTLAAIQRLAAAAGHPLPLPAAPAASGQSPGSSIPLFAFVVGLILIALAWTASLRARPLTLR